MQLLIMKQDKPPHYKGDIIETRASGSPFTSTEANAFVLVKVPGEPMKDFKGYNLSWQRELAFKVVSSDTTNDSYRLRLYSTVVDNNGNGAITKEEINEFIQAWNGTVVDYGDNEVTFDIAIYDALVSPAFWEIPNIADKVSFTKKSYDESTGVHRIELDYSNIDNNPTYVEGYVERMGLEIVSHDNKILTYDADRSMVDDVLKKELANTGRKQIARRRYHVSESVVDTIIDNGGTYETDKSTLMDYIKDKVAE